MAEKPFEEISISELISKAGIARSTYYRNYNSKQEIVGKFINGVFEQFMIAYP